MLQLCCHSKHVTNRYKIIRSQKKHELFL